MEKERILIMMGPGRLSAAELVRLLEAFEGVAPGIQVIESNLGQPVSDPLKTGLVAAFSLLSADDFIRDGLPVLRAQDAQKVTGCACHWPCKCASNRKDIYRQPR